MRIIIVGAGGGIGSALLQQCLQSQPYAVIEATYHNHKPDISSPNLSWHQLDITDEQSIEEFSHNFLQVDWIINCVGILHSSHHHPEKNIKQLDPDFFIDNIRRNALPTMLIAKHFQNKLSVHPSSESQHAKLVVLSARIGSIEDNRAGGWHSYRASKAALNMVLKNLHIEWGRLPKPIAVMALHPGTTDTMLSKPFQRNLPSGQLMSAQQTAQRVYQQIVQLNVEQSGSFVDFNGKAIPW